MAAAASVSGSSGTSASTATATASPTLSQLIDADTGEPRLQSQILGAVTLEQTPLHEIYTTRGNGVQRQLQRTKQLVAAFVRASMPGTPPPTSIVLGIGSTELIAATYWAVAQMLARDVEVRNMWSPPYYTLHKRIAGMLKGVAWSDDKFVDVDGTGSADIVNVVSPNNPDGRCISSSQPAPTAPFVVIDNVYAIDLFTGGVLINEGILPSAGRRATIMLNSFSKIGLVSARLGFALVYGPDAEALAKLMESACSNLTLGYAYVGSVLTEAQLARGLELSFVRRVFATLQRRRNMLMTMLERIFPNGQLRRYTASPFAPYLMLPIPPSWFLALSPPVQVRDGAAVSFSSKTSRVQLMLTSREWLALMHAVKGVALDAAQTWSDAPATPASIASSPFVLDVASTTAPEDVVDASVSASAPAPASASATV